MGGWLRRPHRSMCSVQRLSFFFLTSRSDVLQARTYVLRRRNSGSESSIERFDEVRSIVCDPKRIRNVETLLEAFIQRSELPTVVAALVSRDGII